MFGLTLCSNGKIATRTQAGIDRQRNGQRNCGFLVEDGDLLFVTVFLQNEIVFLEAPDGEP